MAFMEEPPRCFKVVILGEAGVGKTSLLMRLVHNRFDDRLPPTIHGNYLTKQMRVDGQPVELNVWDTAGQERFDSLTPIYYRGASAALLVFDICDRNSFLRVKKWAKELRRTAGREMLLVLAGNKMDHDEHRTVPADQARMFAESIGTTVCYVSAKAGKGVEQAFQSIASGIVGREQEMQHLDELESLTAGTRNAVRVNDNSSTSNSNGSCFGSCAESSEGGSGAKNFEDCFLDVGGVRHPGLVPQRQKPRRPVPAVRSPLSPYSASHS